MDRYRKKPVVIEAVRFTEEAADAIDALPGVSVTRLGPLNTTPRPPIFEAKIKTLEGTMHAQPGDYIIRGVQGELYPCKPDIFDKTYEAVEETA